MWLFVLILAICLPLSAQDLPLRYLTEGLTALTQITQELAQDSPTPPTTLSWSGRWTTGLRWYGGDLRNSNPEKDPFPDPVRLWELGPEAYTGLNFRVQLLNQGPWRLYWAGQYSSQWGDSDGLTLQEAALGYQAPWGQIHVGRHRFYFGPLGLLIANAFDGFAGISGNYGLWQGVYARLATDVAVYPEYSIPFDADHFWAIRKAWALPQGVAGVSLLLQGLGDERGAGADLMLQFGPRRLVGELAVFEASSTTLPDWQLGRAWALVLAVDLVATPDTVITLQGGRIDRGFFPISSALAHAGGHIPFSNGETGLELVLSQRIGRQWVGEMTLGHSVRFDAPGYRGVMSLNYFHSPRWRTQLSLSKSRRSERSQIQTLILTQVEF